MITLLVLSVLLISFYGLGMAILWALVALCIAYLIIWVFAMLGLVVGVIPTRVILLLVFLIVLLYFVSGNTIV